MGHKSTRNALSIALGSGVLLIAGMTMGVGSMGMFEMGPRIEREGDSAHRQALTQIENRPFDFELMGALEGWAADSTMDAASLEGKVVLIAFVSADEPGSLKTLSSLARYQRLNTKKGLVVLAVHPESGWDTMQEKIDAGRVKVQVVRDVEGVLEAGVQADGYPDLFLIDRAGQMRYADIANKSLTLAISTLVRESAEDAIAIARVQLKRNAMRDEDSTQEAQKTNESGDPGSEPGSEPGSDPSSEPGEGMDGTKAAQGARRITPEQYARANWPTKNTGELNAKDVQGQMLPVPLGNEVWISKRVDLEGKVIVLDFWATWCGPCKRASPGLDKLQKEFVGKLNVLAIGGQSDPEQKVRAYANTHKVAYSHLYDAKQSIYRRLEIRAIPHTLIISTDGVIRWQGNPLSPDFDSALRQVIREDPMFASD